MYALNVPEPWMIAELENLRRVRETEGDRPTLELPLPPPPPPAPRSSEERAPRTVIVIEL